MSLLCRIRFHAPVSRPVWNDGFFFGRCTRCSRELIRGPQARWTRVPAGHRVVWRERPAGYPRWEALQPTPSEVGSFLSRFQGIRGRTRKVSVAETLLTGPEDTRSVRQTLSAAAATPREQPAARRLHDW